MPIFSCIHYSFISNKQDQRSTDPKGFNKLIRHRTGRAKMGKNRQKQAKKGENVHKNGNKNMGKNMQEGVKRGKNRQKLVTISYNQFLAISLGGLLSSIQKSRVPIKMAKHSNRLQPKWVTLASTEYSVLVLFSRLCPEVTWQNSLPSGSPSQLLSTLYLFYSPA